MLGKDEGEGQLEGKGELAENVEANFQSGV